MRSYAVLGETDKAREALARGKAALTENKAAAEELASLAASLGVEEPGSQ